MFPLEEGFGEPWFPMSVHPTLFKMGRFRWKIGGGFWMALGAFAPKLLRRVGFESGSSAN